MKKHKLKFTLTEKMILRSVIVGATVALFGIQFWNRIFGGRKSIA